MESYSAGGISMNNLTLIDYRLEATVKPRVFVRVDGLCSCDRLSVVQNITLNALGVNVNPLTRYENKIQNPIIGNYNVNPSAIFQSANYRNNLDRRFPSQMF